MPKLKYHLKTDIKGRPPKPFLRNGYYHIRQWIDGRDVWRSLKTKDKKEAEALAYRIWYAQQQLIVQHEVLTLPSMRLKDAWERHEASERYSLLAESSKRTRKNRWGNFVTWLDKAGVKTLENIDKRTCERYLDEVGKDSNKTYNNTKSDLSMAIADACRDQDVDNPFIRIPNRITSRGDKASVPFRELTKDELSRIIEQLPLSNTPNKDEWLLAVKIALLTGLRSKDVIHLHTDSIHNGFISLIPAKTSNTAKAVLIKVSPELAKLLEGKSGFVLPKLASSYNETTGKTGKQFMKFLHKIGIDDDDNGKAAFHSLRVCVASEASRHGVDIESLGGILGHASTRQTEHYNKASAQVDLSFLCSLICSKDIAETK